ncbi:dihydroneopterin aldolase [Burkholderia pseudomallei]|uniref:dihydroneopterin aldolase n=1 Tax=Burkholderia pseudomallei TaxID=28450 RepID=UPI00018A507B|nr:dihydroneopterin aldolase [Burkholderia pseudomallei]AIP00009.1 FolB domain protein [Burkholderia pseudomallei 576]AIV46395.1 FolB domain protein [Burkholderia pseudomallei TSV 48]EEC31724.1 dihydroneopterin aldolase [Burkholderia pseudomallei 576]KGC26998.1 FolB domain protein [Burkholderia pseudomallei]KGD25978.1 FolB domain protein [Burkholderia pseudomallei]
MKPVEEPFAALDPARSRGRGWSVFVDALKVPARIGIHAHEHAAPQPVVIDARLAYRREPSEASGDGWIDYDAYCARLASFLARKPHTRLLETLALEIAVLSFDEWPALDALTLALHKPKIRPGTKRVGVELDWTRGDYRAWRVASEPNGTSSG